MFVDVPHSCIQRIPPKEQLVGCCMAQHEDNISSVKLEQTATQTFLDQITHAHWSPWGSRVLTPYLPKRRVIVVHCDTRGQLIAIMLAGGQMPAGDNAWATEDVRNNQMAVYPMDDSLRVLFFPSINDGIMSALLLTKYKFIQRFYIFWVNFCWTLQSLFG